MNVTRLFSIVIACGVGLMSVDSSIAQQSTPADVPVNEINSATRSLVEGRIDEALEQYHSAADAAGENHTLSYNRGIALYRQGSIDDARQQFLHALDSTDTTLAAKSWFNLGNCDYSDAVGSAEQDRPAAISSLQSAISQYRRSLKLNRADNDARANIELAAKWIKQLQQEDEKDQQQQDQQENQQQQQDENQNQNNTSDDESESGDQNEQQKGAQQQKGDQQQESAAENQGDDSSDPSKEKSAADSAQKQKAQNSQQPAEQNKDRDPEDESEQGQDASEQNQPESSTDEGDQQPQENAQPQQGKQAQPNETQPERDSATGQGAEQKNDPQSKGQQQGTPAAGGYGTGHAGTAAGEMDKQEAMKMLQAIRDRDLLRRIDKLRETKRRHIPVERDW